MKSDESEKQIQSLPQRVRDPALNAYVQGLVCKLAADYCGDIRVYILDIPVFNASMAANGMMLVYTGLLLRCDNEAQLAFVLAHEIAHFRLRHSLDGWRRMVNTTGAIGVLAIVSGGAGVFGLVGLLAQMSIAAGFMSFSRDQEREADTIGFDLATAQGYDPHEARNLWTNVSTEDDADPAVRNANSFTSSHPTSAERLAAMTQKADAVADARKDWAVAPEHLQAEISPFRAAWYSETLEFQHSGAFLTVLERKVKNDPQSGELQYYLAEAFRRRNAPGDLERARDAYLAAISCANAPAAAQKGLGIVDMKIGAADAARAAFAQYLELAPTAEDRAMIEYYVSRL